MHAAFRTGLIAAGMALTASSAMAQMAGSTSMAGQVGGPSGRVGNAGQAVAAPGTRSDGGIAGSPTRAGAGPRLQSIIPPSGAARTGLLGGESYEQSGIAGRPRATGASPGMSNDMGSVNSYERRLEKAGDAASGVGASPQAFGSGSSGSGDAPSTTGGTTTGSTTGSTNSATGRSISPTTPASPASGNAQTQGSVTPDTGG